MIDYLTPSEPGDERYERKPGRGQLCMEMQELQGEQMIFVSVLEAPG